jgi:hypothetical protein
MMGVDPFLLLLTDGAIKGIKITPPPPPPSLFPERGNIPKNKNLHPISVLILKCEEKKPVVKNVFYSYLTNHIRVRNCNITKCLSLIGPDSWAW